MGKSPASWGVKRSRSTLPDAVRRRNAGRGNAAKSRYRAFLHRGLSFIYKLRDGADRKHDIIFLANYIHDAILFLDNNEAKLSAGSEKS